MKTKNYKLKSRSFTLLMILLGLFVSINVLAQEDNADKKKVHIKKLTEENGEKIVIDTIMYIDDLKDLHDLDIMKDVHIEHVDGDQSDQMKNIWVSIDDDDDTHVIKHSGNDGKTIIIKTRSGDKDEDIRMIIESEIDDEDINIKVIDGDTIIKKSVKKVTVETDEEGTYTIYINDEDEGDSKSMIFISEDGDTEVIESEGEYKYVVIKKDKDGNISKDGEKTMIWVSDDGEKIEIKEVGEDGDLKWISEDGEEYEIKGNKVITKEIHVTIEDADDAKGKDKDKKKSKNK